MQASFFLLFSVLANAVRMTKMKIQTNGLKKKNSIFPMMNMIKKGRLQSRPGVLVFDDLLGGLVFSVVARDGQDVSTG